MSWLTAPARTTGRSESSIRGGSTIARAGCSAGEGMDTWQSQLHKSLCNLHICNLHTSTTYIQVQPTYKYKLHASTTYIQVQTTYKYNLHTRICSTFKTLIIVVDFEEHKNSLWWSSEYTPKPQGNPTKGRPQTGTTWRCTPICQVCHRTAYRWVI